MPNLINVSHKSGKYQFSASLSEVKPDDEAASSIPIEFGIATRYAVVVAEPCSAIYLRTKRGFVPTTMTSKR